ncbi:MAG: hypothetical protein R2940_05465 [Syntrophotaleaceae bacterium]
MSGNDCPSLIPFERLESQGGTQATACPSSALSSVDVGRLVGDLSRTFNPLAREFELDTYVRPLPGDMVHLSVVLPQGMTRAFVALLESLVGFVRFVDRKVSIAEAEARAVVPDEIEKAREHREEFQVEVCRLFDGFIQGGLEEKEALRRTNQAMKEQKHPWAVLDLVRITLRDAGRLGKRRKARRTTLPISRS